MRSVEIKIPIEGQGAVSGLLFEPSKAEWLLVLAHGAGAGMRHAFMEQLACELASVKIATLRYQFPYMEKGRGGPDRPALLTLTVASAVRKGAQELDLPLLAGGKSMGGRMTSTAASEGLLEAVRGLIFFGFPLHPPGNPGTKRAEHLKSVPQPMLFLQGTRDTLADLKLLKPICKTLGARATLEVIDTADHSFHVLKSSGSDDARTLKRLAEMTAAWAAKL